MAGRYFRAWVVSVAVALAIGFTATSCDNDGGRGGTGATGDNAAGSPSTTAAANGDDSPTTPGGDGDGPTGSGSASTTTTARGGQQPTGGGSPTTAPPTPADSGGATGPVGAYARTLLRPAPGGGQGSVVLDVLSQSGSNLRGATLGHLSAVLTRESGKTVDVQSSGQIPGDRRSWTATAIAAAADGSATVSRTGSRPAIRVLALRGEFADQDSAIGVAVRGDVFAIFTDQVARAATPLVRSSEIEDAVTIHELGHLLGLVDLVVDRNRDDPEHPSHSRNRASVMYWAIESDLVAQVLDGPPANDFDADDRSDLAAIRGGG